MCDEIADGELKWVSAMTQRYGEIARTEPQLVRCAIDLFRRSLKTFIPDTPGFLTDDESRAYKFRARALAVFEVGGPVFRDAIPDCIALLEVSAARQLAADFRPGVLRAMAAISGADPTALEAVARSAQYEWVRVQAVKAIGYMHAYPDEASPALHNILASATPRVGIAALLEIGALDRVRAKTMDEVKRLIQVADDPAQKRELETIYATWSARLGDPPK